jgi:hypothetical protein
VDGDALASMIVAKSENVIDLEKIERSRSLSDEELVELAAGEQE